jgi:hypothetical protein
VAEKIAQFDSLNSPWTSCRRIAGQMEVPARTLHHWVRRERTLIANSSWPKRDAVSETPRADLSIDSSPLRIWCSSGGRLRLATCVGSSGSVVGRIHRLFLWSPTGGGGELESLLVRFGEEEDRRLAATMPPREITHSEDETFHPQICLVAIEPVSNFILVEQYQPQRDAKTWQQCTSTRLASLPVTVCQVTSDAAKALIAQAETCLACITRRISFTCSTTR